MLKNGFEWFDVILCEAYGFILGHIVGKRMPTSELERAATRTTGGYDQGYAIGLGNTWHRRSTAWHTTSRTRESGRDD